MTDLRTSILKDYRKRTHEGDYRYTKTDIAERNGLSPAELEEMLSAARLRRNAARMGFRLWSCPNCGFRALHPLGHARCMGNAELAEAEASQALLVAGATAILREEEVA